MYDRILLIMAIWAATPEQGSIADCGDSKPP